MPFDLFVQRWGVSPLKAGSGLMLKEGWTAAGLLRAFRSSHRTDHPCAQPPRHRAEPSQGVLRAPDEGEGALAQPNLLEGCERHVG